MEEEYIFQGRIAVCEPRDKDIFNQNSISGVLISLKGQPLLSESKDWENVQCEIVIRPIKRLGTAKIKNMRLDQACLALSDDKQWKTEESDEKQTK